MRAVIQRVSQASIEIDHQLYSRIGAGFVVLLGIHRNDQKEDVDWLAAKIANLRVFADEKGLMNLSITETKGEILLISQFTLIAAYKKGNRPSFIDAARPEQAIPLYEQIIQSLSEHLGRPISTGQFGADMKIQLQNDGPVTIVMDTQTKD